MDQVTHLGNWKLLLDELESDDSSSNLNQSIEALTNLFHHLSPQTAPRLQKEFEDCTIKSEKVLEKLFDKIDLSDNLLLCSFLRLLLAFGYFRLTQITFHIDNTIREEEESIYFPSILKVKWYEMTPLLPEAGTIGWKGIMNHCLVREEKDLSQTCLNLLSQKLHFYTILSLMDRFQLCSSLTKRNGKRVADKLFELIRDVAYENDRMIGLEEHIFNLSLPFIDVEQQAALIDAIVQDLFKPFLANRSVNDEDMIKLYTLVNNCIMSKTTLQDIFISKLMENLKINMIRLKRRHSVEVIPENGNITWKSLIDDIDHGDKLLTVLPKVDQVEISSKTIQSSYISYWINVVKQILPQKTLTATNSLKILGVCSFLVIKTSSLSNETLLEGISTLLARTIDWTAQNRLDKFFSSCNPGYISELTKTLFEKIERTSITDVPLLEFYKSYLKRYLKCCTLKVVKLDHEELASLVTVICDKDICDQSGYMLQNVCVREMANCIEDFKNRMSNKIIETYLDCARMCSKRLYKFIKRNSSLKNDLRIENGDIDMDDLSELHDSLVDNDKRIIAIDSLVCILRIAIERQDQEILDCYGDLLHKLFNVVESRFEIIVESVQTGIAGPSNAIDPYLAKLTMLYIEHKEVVSPYIQQDLVENLSNIIVKHAKKHVPVGGELQNGSTKSNKKSVYLQLKSKLENLENQTSNNKIDVYQTIINKQYSNIVDRGAGSSNDILKEDVSCTHSYSELLKILEDIFATVAENSSPKVRSRLLNDTVTWLENCDPLDHTRFIYIILLIESLIPKNNSHSKTKQLNSDEFNDALPRISCSLIRLSKTVELGPSIHAYKNSGAHKSNRGIQCCTYAHCIRIYTAIFQNHTPKVASSYITDAMQICISSNLIQYAKHSIKLHRFFIQLSSAIVELLKSVCIDRKEDEIIRCSMPIFLTVFSHLIRCVILASDRQKLEIIPKSQSNGNGNSANNRENFSNTEEPGTNPLTIKEEYEKKLELLAIDIGKCLNNMCSLRVKLVDHAPHLITTYIRDIQRAACPDFIRLHLNEGIFRVFNLVDAHQKERQAEVVEAGIQRKTMAARASDSLFEMIHARLDQASREIFRDMYENHTKFHRYVGKC